MKQNKELKSYEIIDIKDLKILITKVSADKFVLLDKKNKSKT